MFEDRSLKLDLCALALLALVVFLGIALWTYDPTDPPSTLVWPPSDVVHNACGRAGALAAHYLFESLGIGAYYLAGSLAVLTFFLLARREIDQPHAPHRRLGDLGRRPDDARRAGDAELDARARRRRRRLHRRDGPQAAWKRTSPKPARTSSRSACCWPACCCRPTTSCSAPPP